MEKFSSELENCKNYIFFKAMIKYCKKQDQLFNIFIRNLRIKRLWLRNRGNVLDVIWRSKRNKLQICTKKFLPIQ